MREYQWDSIRWFLVLLLPRFVCVWLWERGPELHGWAPFVFGRVVERRPERVVEKGIHHD
jgi:hypothetical protein